MFGGVSSLIKFTSIAPIKNPVKRLSSATKSDNDFTVNKTVNLHDYGMPYCIVLGIMYSHYSMLFFLCCSPFILYSQFLNVSTYLYNTVHYVRAIQICFWQLLINLFLVIFDDFYLILM